MKAQLTEIILINLLQHKSPKFSSQKMASILKRGQKNPFHYTNLCFLNYHLIFQLIRWSAYHSFDWGKFFSSSYTEIIHSATVKLFVFNVDEY